MVDEPLAENRPEPHLLDRLGGPVHVEVHVVEACSPAPDHLEACELLSPVHVFRFHLCLPRPDRLLQPILEAHVVRIAPEERHRRVRVRVHEPGDGGLPAAIEDRVRFHLPADLHYPIVLDVDGCRRTLELDVLDEDAQWIASRARTTMSRNAVALRSCIFRIASNVSGRSTIPLQKLSTEHRDAYRSPSSDARVASEAIVIPRISPIFRKCAISARVSRRGPLVCT